MGKLRGDVGDLEEPSTFALCKHGVANGYCITNCSRPSKSIASDHNIGLMKRKSIIDVDSTYMVKRQKGKGIKLTQDAKPNNLDAGNVVFTVKDFYTKAAAEKPLRTDPAPVASWMGSFILKGEKARLGFQAHLTSEGLSKVNEFSRNMPEVLVFELCPYEYFLRTVFKGCDPDDEDIGLYFFPDNSVRPDTYSSHLEQLSRNFCLRSCIDGVELLVFTSKVLHNEYRSRNKSDFLWGLYRHCHGKLNGSVEETMAVDMDIASEEVDMDVDMIGGEIVGTVDVVVPKQSMESDLDVPPGFTPSMRGQWLKLKKEVEAERLELD